MIHRWTISDFVRGAQVLGPVEARYAPVAASTPPYLPWFAPGYGFPPDPPMGPRTPDPVPSTERAQPTTPESEPAKRSEWCCGGTCLRVNCEYHRDQ